jgi:hypothetical protein
MPRHRQPQLRVAHVHRVDHDEVAEPALRTLRLLRARAPEHPLEVPGEVAALAQHDVRALDVHALQMDAPVDQIAWVVDHANPARRGEQ